VNILWEKFRNFPDNVSTKNMDQGAALGGSEQNAFGPDGRGEVGYRVRGRITHRVAWNDRLTETPRPEGFKDLPRLFVLGPFSTAVSGSDHGLLPDIEDIEGLTVIDRLINGKIESAT
jgi:hypothetical protein